MTTTNTKTLLTVKTDKAIKKAAERTAEEIGLPLGTVVNGFLRTFIAEKRIEFSAPLVPNARTRRAIAEAEREYAQGKLKVYTSAEALIRDLNA